MTEDRERLIEGMLRSDERAWRDFLVRYGRLIHSVIGRFGIRDERDDLFQEVCSSIHRSLGTLHDPDRLVTWIYSVTYRHAIDAVARRRRTPTQGSVDPDADPIDPAPGADTRLEEMQQVAVIMDLIDGLRPRCREILGALYLEDPPVAYEEISRRHGIPVGSIGPTRARCLDELRRALGRVSGTASSPTTGNEQAQPSRTGATDVRRIRERSVGARPDTEGRR
ncbi:MAG: sigma-70 family RNA polymerase sigma factor [Candidatus Eiseniibacteriota bacterium]|jgi:RNA polymerase sigma factor (sigma-70 family)